MVPAVAQCQTPQIAARFAASKRKGVARRAFLKEAPATPVARAPLANRQFD